MRRWSPVAAVVMALTALCAAAASAQSRNDLEQVRAAESAFAKTMETRDRAAFATFVSQEAVFFGGQTVLRGRPAVVDGWAAFFKGRSAPFSWRPDVVEVLDSGALALSSGPVMGRDGQQIGTFNSIWRKEQDGRWRVVFDKGCN